jgi:hypothetical protein
MKNQVTMQGQTNYGQTNTTMFQLRINDGYFCYRRLVRMIENAKAVADELKAIEKVFD